MGQQHSKELQEVIMQDLPQLFCQNKVPILEFLNIDYTELQSEIKSSAMQSSMQTMQSIEE